IRSPQKQTSPWLMKLALIVVSITSSKSESAKTMLGFFPPISNDTFFKLSAADFMIAFPVLASPVNVIASTSGCLDIASPAESGPNPWTRLTTPSGTPASEQICAKTVAVIGVVSAGFIIAVFPAAKHGANFQVIRKSGRFHGLIIPTTPTGL